MKNEITNTRKFTFKPLAQGWYKCNQTKERTRNPERYADIRYKAVVNAERQKAKLDAEKRREAEIAGLQKALIRYNECECPFCGTDKYWPEKDSIIKCSNCGQKYYAVGSETFFGNRQYQH